MEQNRRLYKRRSINENLSFIEESASNIILQIVDNLSSPILYKSSINGHEGKGMTRQEGDKEAITRQPVAISISITTC